MNQEQSERLHMRVTWSFLRAVDEWRRKQADLPSRTEAIRRLVELGLGHAPPTGRLAPQARAKASALASEVVDRIADDSAPAEEEEKRKRRLIKGPLEFRELRRDQIGSRTSGTRKGKRS